MKSAVALPNSDVSPLVVTKLATALALAGMRQEPPVVSQIEQVAMFAATDAPAPPLLPPGERSVSYALQVVPPQLLRTLLPPTNAVVGFVGSSLRKPTSEATVIPEMIAPFARSCATMVISHGAKSCA